MTRGDRSHRGRIELSNDSVSTHFTLWETLRPVEKDEQDKMNRRSLASEIIIGSLLFVSLIVVNASLTSRNSRLARQISEDLNSTYDIVRGTNQLLLSLVNSETGQRGYLLTGEEEFLEPFNKAKALVPIQLEQLRKKVAENEVQSTRVKLLMQKRENRLTSCNEAWKPNARSPPRREPSNLHEKASR